MRGLNRLMGTDRKIHRDGAGSPGRNSWQPTFSCLASSVLEYRQFFSLPTAPGCRRHCRSSYSVPARPSTAVPYRWGLYTKPPSTIRTSPISSSTSRLESISRCMFVGTHTLNIRKMAVRLLCDRESQIAIRPHAPAARLTDHLLERRTQRRIVSLGPKKQLICSFVFHPTFT